MKDIIRIIICNIKIIILFIKIDYTINKIIKFGKFTLKKYRIDILIEFLLYFLK